MHFFIIDVYFIYTNHNDCYNDINFVDFLNKPDDIFVYRMGFLPQGIASDS